MCLSLSSLDKRPLLWAEQGASWAQAGIYIDRRHQHHPYITENCPKTWVHIAVPQDGFIIPTASLRFNLDPYHTSSDQEMSLSLQRTGLWDKIHSPSAGSAEKAGKPIVILDEVSSSLDSETESILIDILRDELRDYTVVMVAYRVAGIMGAMRPEIDAIATMPDGGLSIYRNKAYFCK
ncbi:hypothetical protein N7522_011715 [Penicillium canescens]|uniref:Uncharacterized protein n=1 Tax=Penicillium canescens TaxID=5083 RepID=A0AAD6IMD7_PENCN|nr:uncharacterized protein N7446_007432 [Penicillium canescens]KAJ5991508.1 hypothetical protein N7522_011715 [Penicillium canescens]KAJ6049239.1 hypothetical protein N7444_005955 [Penicillium canescens]KAJ6052789.1 hypothetical protein N7460_003323 [Penicillium canescens]KAJ6063312.1 hypothetical protein N7446_007432 [Penicillium canescens]